MSIMRHCLHDSMHTKIKIPLKRKNKNINNIMYIEAAEAINVQIEKVRIITNVDLREKSENANKRYVNRMNRN